MDDTSALVLKMQNKVLQATFANNMKMLKQYMPEIYIKFKNFTPQHTHLILDENGYINLTNNGKLVYEGDPKATSQSQVEAFKANPSSIDYTLKLGKRNGLFRHTDSLRRVIKRRKSDMGDTNRYFFPIDGQIDFIAFIGTGLGFSVEHLFSMHNIRYAFLYEPDLDCFFALLHTIDLAKMITKCIADGGKMAIKVGGDSTKFVNDISQVFVEVGYYNISKFFLYRHYHSQRTDQAIEKINALAHRYLSGWGFCEDETIGIHHTIANIGQIKSPVLLQKAGKSSQFKPIFIVGNGPSLDYSFDYLRDNAKNALIISCGTALKPLLDNGIIPDSHIEMERTAGLFEWLDSVGHKATLKQINLICLNTVYPEVGRLFKKSHLVLKPNDLGFRFMHNYVSDCYQPVEYCNPTVTNAATATMVALGFKTLYLFGVDYGFTSIEHHHSRDSLYFKDNDHLPKAEIAFDLSVKGNFKPQVLSTHVLDKSRSYLEFLLNYNKDVKCINTCDGAFISGSEACKIEALPRFKAIKDKEVFIEKLLAKSFSNRKYSALDLQAEFMKILPEYKNHMLQLLRFVDNVTNRIELSEAFRQQYAFIRLCENNRSKELFLQSMIGSLNYMQSNIMANVYQYGDVTKQNEFIAFCLLEMKTHFLWLIDNLSNTIERLEVFKEGD